MQLEIIDKNKIGLRPSREQNWASLNCPPTENPTNNKNQDLKQIKQTNNLWNFHLGEFGEIIRFLRIQRGIQKMNLTFPSGNNFVAEMPWNLLKQFPDPLASGEPVNF